ncbi:hypothetical protein CB1_002208002 [Camelus ferus]|nr:hypothetical protein CB1_002208002 [Camelus ferus]
MSVIYYERSPKEGQVPHNTNRVQDGLWGVDGPLGSRDETYRVWTLQRHRLQKLVASLVPTVLGGNPSYLHTFLGKYRSFTTAPQVLDLLFQRFREFEAKEEMRIQQGQWIKGCRDCLLQPHRSGTSGTPSP